MKYQNAIKKFRRNEAARFWMTEFSRLLIPGLGVPLTVCILDNLLAFSFAVRVTLLVIYIFLLFVMLFVSLMHFLKKRPTDRECALALEKASGIRDNSLVNAVSFAKDPTLSPVLRNVFLSQAENVCSALKFSYCDPGMKKLFSVSVFILCCCLFYGVVFFRHFENAMTRFFNPAAAVSALNFVHFEVKPGFCHIPKGQNLEIRARAWKDGHSISGLQLLVRGKGNPVLYPMQDGTHILRDLREELVYSIQAAGESSEEFKIRLISPPPVRNLVMSVRPPAYTGLKESQINLQKVPENTVPAGSKIRITVESLSGVEQILYRNGCKTGLPDFFELKQDTRLSLQLCNRGIVFSEVWSGGIKMKKDVSPSVRFLNAKTNLEVLYGQVIPIEMESTDDYGTAELILSATVEKRTFDLRRYRYPVPGSKKLREIFLLKPTFSLVPSGSVLELSLSAADYGGGRSRSATTITIHPADPEVVLRRAGKDTPAGKCYEQLLSALQIQIEARDYLASRIKNLHRGIAEQVVLRQNRIHSGIVRAEKFAVEAKMPDVFRKAIHAIAVKYALPLVKKSGQLRRKNSRTTANEIVLCQTELISILKKLTCSLALREQQEARKKEKRSELDSEKELYEQLKDLKENVDRFKKEQQKVKSDTEAFDPKKTDDFSESEEKLLGELALRELDWSKYFKAVFSDLSKKQNQDFSNSAMADEFVEIYEELQKAGEALKAKKIEIATLAEANAAANAESIAANIERWLADKADYIKWNSEEDGKEKTTNLTDLPAELTDIIGDLIEQEGDEGEDQVQDSTNSFSWDTDDGLGWGVSDGPIDSMQAKGITGNVLPNKNEVGGRSGEGRSGKSVGQFVEKEATGKGGRKTPTRLVQTPFEKGSVDDKSKESQGGATGGGKQGGSGEEGLSGTTPDQEGRTGIRSGNLGELRQRTKAMLKMLSDRNLPTGDLRDALEKLEKLDKIGTGGGTDIRRVRSDAISSLRRARSTLETAVAADAERKRARRKETWSIKHNRSETVPESCGECVGQYFKALASEGENE